MGIRSNQLTNPTETAMMLLKVYDTKATIDSVVMKTLVK
jgi:hypothetical protein